MDISVITPVFNEEESLKELTDWISSVMEQNNYSYEILMIDDGSTDQSWKIIEELNTKNANIRGIKFLRNYGKAAALHTGFEAAKGDVVITMDSDLQDSPDEIPELYEMIMKQGYDLVSGWKKKRYDPRITKNIPSKLYNKTVRMFTGIKLHDFNCGLKAYTNKVIKNIEVYGEMHRYIPVLAKRAGFKKIGEKVVTHRKRKYGTTKYGVERFVNGFLDLLTILFISKFGKRPMHFFGTLGTIFFLAGFSFAGYLSIRKIFYHEGMIATRPLFHLGILCMIIGVQLFLSGFLGELISRNSSTRNDYKIEKSL